MLPEMARAMVLCAGLGTRLRPLTEELPKPLLPLGDRTLLEHALAALSEAELGSEVVVNVHHLPARFEELGQSLPFRVRVVSEPRILGTAGGIANARAWLGPPPVVVTIGDAVLGGVPRDFADAARAGGMVLAVRPLPAGVGTVGVGADGAIVRLRGERFGAEAAGGDYVGLLALGERALAELPETGCYIGDYALPMLRRGERVNAYRYERSAWFPGDDVRSYAAANWRWLEQRALSRFVAATADVGAGVELERVIVSRGARLAGDGRVARVVLLPGAAAMAPLENAVVLPSGRIVAVP